MFEHNGQKALDLRATRQDSRVCAKQVADKRAFERCILGVKRNGNSTDPPASYQIQPTTIWTEPPSVGDLRRRGALN